MCHPVKCRVCGKTTWSGCGQHIAAVKSMVPKNQWCDGNHTPEERKAAKAEGGFFSRFWG
ncbi:MAG: hypothetical protein Q4E03_01485 [Trueperella sp.]|nr:hypothetical protein [Trueperella sp.]